MLTASRREVLRLSTGVLAGLSLGVPAALGAASRRLNMLPQQAQPPKPAAGGFPTLDELRRGTLKGGILATNLKDNIHLLEGIGGNILFVNDPNGALIVDCGVLGAGQLLLDMCKELGASRISTLVNTHWHFDHTDNNSVMRKTGASIVAHTNVRTRLSTQQEIVAFRWKVPPSESSALPTVTFADTLTLSAGGHTLALTHMPPAHTDGDVVVYLREANILHAGDIAFIGMYPVIDQSSNGSIDGTIAALETIHGMINDQTVVIPGHGPITDRAGLKKFRDLLVDSRERIAKAAEGGKSLEEVIAAKPLKGQDPSLSVGPFNADFFTRTVYPMVRGGR